MDVGTLVEDFTSRLAALIRKQTIERVLVAVADAVGPDVGLVRRAARAGSLFTGRKSRRKGPIQLCPVPGCENRAAPAFAMVCLAHKDLPKAKIKAFREARRKAKLAAKAGAKPKTRAPSKARKPSRRPAHIAAARRQNRLPRPPTPRPAEARATPKTPTESKAVVPVVKPPDPVKAQDTRTGAQP